MQEGNLIMNYWGHCNKRKWTLQGDSDKERVRLNQGESLRPLCNLWVSMPSYILTTVVRGQHIACKHTPCAHITAVLRQRNASQTALPFTEKKTRVWINSLSIYGLKEVLGLHSSKKCIFSSFFHYTADHGEGISTGWTGIRTGNLDMAM